MENKFGDAVRYKINLNSTLLSALIKQPCKMIFQMIAHGIAEQFGGSVFQNIDKALMRYEGF